jgi:hypothetical protein
MVADSRRRGAGPLGRRSWGPGIGSPGSLAAKGSWWPRAGRVPVAASVGGGELAVACEESLSNATLCTVRGERERKLLVQFF